MNFIHFQSYGMKLCIIYISRCCQVYKVIIILRIRLPSTIPPKTWSIACWIGQTTINTTAHNKYLKAYSAQISKRNNKDFTLKKISFSDLTSGGNYWLSGSTLIFEKWKSTENFKIFIDLTHHWNGRYKKIRNTRVSWWI